ncbi:MULTISPECIES: thioredoxin family protein [Leptolyngbya]|uniref:Thioredoxin family protein n=1 Tax=Leptolyngbya boryana CZ1 TaxID=3060204 RepID=A0AA96WNE5_LEPBY|nr:MULTISPECIES: thioredoxin family protein [Leptolyngbya]MBN8564484.1 thioredoxin family protein [Leptolyngbya sp. UWPOB_LEPTO1]MCY6493495.1 thioredoxin family protein [Leptolyngbya sp. GGD]WNZ43275.1 thioredoxin family protein [Leptolyngbya boryana CZ1]
MGRIFRQRRQLLLYLGLGVVGAGATALKLKPSQDKQSFIAQPILDPKQDLVSVQASGNPLPDFQGIQQWLNSTPLSIADLKGNVVLIQFWTFACINCQRTLPYITRWHRQYAAQGLKVIGIHTPEFAFEREPNNIRKAIEKHQITYPVPVDNEYKTWKAYQNEYWPHLFLADRRGLMRYDHIGEGAYDTTEQMIQTLLKERVL